MEIIKKKREEKKIDTQKKCCSKFFVQPLDVQHWKGTGNIHFCFFVNDTSKHSLSVRLSVCLSTPPPPPPHPARCVPEIQSCLPHHGPVPYRKRRGGRPFRARRNQERDRPTDRVRTKVTETQKETWLDHPHLFIVLLKPWTGGRRWGRTGAGFFFFLLFRRRGPSHYRTKPHPLLVSVLRHLLVPLSRSSCPIVDQSLKSSSSAPDSSITLREREENIFVL